MRFQDTKVPEQNVMEARSTELALPCQKVFFWCKEIRSFPTSMETADLFEFFRKECRELIVGCCSLLIGETS